MALWILFTVAACAPASLPATPLAPTPAASPDATVSPSHGAGPTSDPTPRPTPIDDEITRLITAVAGDTHSPEGELDDLWRDILARAGPGAGFTYESPARVVGYRGGEEVPDSECAVGTDISFWRENARYCPADQAILYDELWLRDFAVRAGVFAPAAILAHEWGHHIQKLNGSHGYSIQLELQADCFAGLYLGASENVVSGTYEIREAELSSGLETFFTIGNREYEESAWFQAFEHGSQQQRSMAFGTGYLGAFGEVEDFGELVNGYPWCDGYGAFEPGDFAHIGPFRLLNPPGRAESWRGSTYVIEPMTSTLQDTSGIRITWLPELPLDGEGATIEQLEAVVVAEVPGAALLYDPVPLTPDAGSGLTHYFERVVPAAPGGGDHESGIMVLLSPAGDEGGLLIIVHRPQPAPRDPLTREKLALITEQLITLYQVVNRLCRAEDVAAGEQSAPSVACLDEQ